MSEASTENKNTPAASEAAEVKSDKKPRAKRRGNIFKPKLPMGWGLFFAVLLAVPEALLTLYIQPGDITVLLRYLYTQPFLAFLNFLPFLLLNLGFTCLFRNPFFASALVGGVGAVLSVVNTLMITNRDEPLSPKDFALIKEAGAAAASYDISLSRNIIFAIVGFVLLMLIPGIFLRVKPAHKKRWKRIVSRILSAFVFFAALVFCVETVYASKDLYNSFPVSYRSYIAGVYNELGFPYCFCYNFNTYLVDKPDGFTTKKAEEYIAGTETDEGDPKNVNVVMVMCEAFCDLTNDDAFNYPEGEEPLKNFNELSQSKNAVAGHIVVSNYGAGTANTEFDVLSGMQTNLISESAGASAFRVVHHELDSVYRVFLNDGFETDFIHPGEDWFYNRKNVYRYFGAQELIFEDRFYNCERKGSWVTDNAVLKVMKEEFSAASENPEPYFNYTVTIQNHMSYTAQKYGDTPIPEAPLNVEVSEDVKTMLSVYAEGARDGDTMLKNLTEYYQQSEEPVLLVFFGDHLPQLGDDYKAYRELGIELGESDDPETTLRTYEVPYIIWANELAAEELDFENAVNSLDLPENRKINANYLGAVTLELTGRGSTDPYFAFLNEMRRELPVLHNNTGMTIDGEYFSAIPEEYSKLIEKLHYWEYYKLKVE